MRVGERRHRLVYAFVRPFAQLFLYKYKFKTDVLPDIGEQYIAMSNHTTEIDMIMLIRALPQHSYFVCGEHLLRSKFGKLISYFFDPIPAPRGASHIGTVREILRRVKNGNNIVFFPEGCRSFNGETLPIGIATGQLVKKAGTALVTYRCRGGYFIAPRWAYKFRKGPAEGKIVNVYSSAQLAEMSAAEITDIINRDIYENSYETQKRNPKAYECDALAEGLENYLVICPECGSYDSMESHGSHFKCRVCNVDGEYDRFGYLQGEALKFNTVFDWGKWIEQRFDSDTLGRIDLLFTEKDVLLYEINYQEHYTTDVGRGELKIYADRIEFGERVFTFASISEMSLLYFGKSVLFQHTCGYFGLTGEGFHAWKLDRLYKNYKSK